ncbi:MAG: branched-chain amino acid ABC transporter permease [Desulfonauticus sp.]|nr:branched-chain amino acid ABC transporter permease [Desulfonauticus sp.]
MRKRMLIEILFVIILFLSPLFLNAYWIDVLNNIGIYAILALSLNIILGHTGLFHMGHAAFYAIGAYTTAILNTMYHIPILWLMPVSGLLAGIFGYLVARPIIHLRGDYLLIVTIGIVEIVRIALVNNIFGLTGGSNGIFGISRPSLGGLVIRKPQQFFYYIWIFLGISVYLFYRLENSRFGRALNYIKEDELAAEGSGINVSKYKLLAFVLGAIWAGFVGNIYASKMTIISPESFSFWESVILFVIVILGGAGSIRGVILGSFLIIGLPELFRQFASARMLIFGAAMVVMMIFRPQGLVPPRSRTYSLEVLIGKE